MTLNTDVKPGPSRELNHAILLFFALRDGLLVVSLVSENGKERQL